MSRSQQNQLFKTSQADADTARTGIDAGLSDVNKRLDTYYAEDPHKTGGEFSKDQSNINAARANADAAAVRESLMRHGKTSGENTSGYGANVVAATRQGTLDEAEAQAKSDADRLRSETGYQQFGVGASQFPVDVNQRRYATDMGTSEQAAKEPGFWDWMMQQAQQGAKTGAAIATA